MTEPSPTEFPADEAMRLELVRRARTWLASTLGQQLLQQERLLLAEELPRLIGSYLVHYGPSPEVASATDSPLFRVHLGADLAGVDVVCEEQAWPVLDHGADAVLLQHGLDFCLSPHSLLREAARCVRPGGQLWIIGLNPWSAWGVRHWFARDALRDARCIGASRVADWLGLLGFALEKRRFGCYCPPLSAPLWQSKKDAWERSLARLPLFGGGFYLLVARKIVVGLRPLPKQRRATAHKLVAIPSLNSETDRND